MCGFTVLLGTDGRRAEPRIVERMTHAILHRGPDDEGSFYAGPVGMGFRRLSILDISPSGHQPMSSEDLTIVFNGEIYNYVELRAELQTLGYRFRSTGDTEVLLKAYREWGPECVKRLNGMWAFVIYDHRDRTLFGSRDRFGMKPLYICRLANHLLLASEIKAIRASGLYQDATNPRVAAAYLLEDRLDETSETFYSGIESIPAAHAFAVRPDGGLKQWRYWSLDEQGETAIADPARAFAELFEDAVRLHMRSDVPVAVNLSGGLDSTSIICASARVRKTEGARDALLAFCYQAPEFDERRYIEDTVRQTGARLVNLSTSAHALWDDLAKMLWYQDEPAHSMTAVIGYQLMRLASDHGIKVVLNGQGADETIGGYANYFRDYWHTLIRQGRVFEAWAEVSRYCAVHGGKPTSHFLGLIRHLIQSALHASAIYRRQAARNADRRLRARNRWFDPSLLEAVQPDRGRHRFDLRSVLKRSVQASPLPLYLRVEDRNAMAHSVEARLPFLDHRLVELVFALPEQWHLRGPWNKFVLREGMRNKIPESVRARADKMGFPFPARQWFTGPLREPLLDVFGSRAARERGLYDVQALLRQAAKPGEQGMDTSAPLFRAAQFELWCNLSPLTAVPRPQSAARVVSL